MSMSDPIADMLTRVRNGLAATKVAVLIPGSKVKAAIAQVLADADRGIIYRQGIRAADLTCKIHQTRQYPGAANVDDLAG